MKIYTHKSIDLIQAEPILIDDVALTAVRIKEEYTNSSFEDSDSIFTNIYMFGDRIIPMCLNRHGEILLCNHLNRQTGKITKEVPVFQTNVLLETEGHIMNFVKAEIFEKLNMECTSAVQAKQMTLMDPFHGTVNLVLVTGLIEVKPECSIANTNYIDEILKPNYYSIAKAFSLSSSFETYAALNTLLLMTNKEINKDEPVEQAT